MLAGNEKWQLKIPPSLVHIRARNDYIRLKKKKKKGKIFELFNTKRTPCIDIPGNEFYQCPVVTQFRGHVRKKENKKKKHYKIDKNMNIRTRI